MHYPAERRIDRATGASVGMVGMGKAATTQAVAADGVEEVKQPMPGKFRCHSGWQHKVTPCGESIPPVCGDVCSTGLAHEQSRLEGIRPHGNYAHLHLTSHKFDEPRCLGLLSSCNHVIAVHGCRRETQQAFIGGLDEALKARVAQAIAELGVDVRLHGHSFPATNPWNICNRGHRGAGIQIEMTTALRRDGPCKAISEAIRAVLLTLST